MKRLILLSMVLTLSSCNPLESDPKTSPDYLNPPVVVSNPSGPTTITVSSSDLNLFANGNARVIIITNTGSSPATYVSYANSPSLPSGTLITPVTCGNIAAGANCTLTITPGGVATAPAGVTSPTPITLTISGTNTNTVNSNFNVLEYGSVVGGGYLFSVDDSSQADTSIRGKVVALNDQATSTTGIVWSSDGAGTGVLDDIPGIYENSTTPGDACNGSTDGSCNSNEIWNFYSLIDPSYYAAGLCKQTIASFSDWYLPSICELGYDTSSNGTGCGNSGTATLQTIQENLIDNGAIGSISGDYWSSTEYSTDPLNRAWVQTLGPGGMSLQMDIVKDGISGVRCIRAI